MKAVRNDAAIVYWLTAIMLMSLLARAFPVPHRPRHRARGRRRPTFTSSPLYYVLGLEGLPAEDAALASPRRAGATSYVGLSKLTRFTRQLGKPGRTVAMIRSAAPNEETS